MTKQNGFRRLLAIGSILALLISLARHAAEPEDIIKYRQNMMKTIRRYAAAADAIVQRKVGYKYPLAEEAHALLALTSNIPACFRRVLIFVTPRPKMTCGRTM